MDKRRLLIVVFLALILTTMPLFWGQAGAAEKKVKIGFCGPLTGSAASWGIAQRDSVRYYAEQSNKAGGMRLGEDRVFFEVFAEDSKYVAGDAVSGVTKLIHVTPYDFSYHRLRARGAGGLHNLPKKLDRSFSQRPPLRLHH